MKNKKTNPCFSATKDQTAKSTSTNARTILVLRVELVITITVVTFAPVHVVSRVKIASSIPTSAYRILAAMVPIASTKSVVIVAIVLVPDLPVNTASYP